MSNKSCKPFLSAILISLLSLPFFYQIIDLILSLLVFRTDTIRIDNVATGYGYTNLAENVIYMALIAMTYGALLFYKGWYKNKLALICAGGLVCLQILRILYVVVFFFVPILGMGYDSALYTVVLPCYRYVTAILNIGFIVGLFWASKYSVVINIMMTIECVIATVLSFAMWPILSKLLNYNYALSSMIMSGFWIIYHITFLALGIVLLIIWKPKTDVEGCPMQGQMPLQPIMPQQPVYNHPTGQTAKTTQP